MSSFCGTCLLSGATILKPKNMNTRINAVLSCLLRLKQTYTFSQSNFSSANSSNDTKLSREPSGNTVDGMSTQSVLLTSKVFHSTSFSSLRLHLKLSNNELGLSAISSKSMNSTGLSLVAFSLFRLDVSLDVVVDDDDDDDDDDDCFLRGVIYLLKLPTLPLIMPPSELKQSVWSDFSFSSAVFVRFVVAAWVKSGIVLRPCRELNT